MACISYEEGREIIRLYVEEGLSCENVGLEVGRSARTIREVLIREGIPRRSPGVGRRGPTVMNMHDGVRGERPSIRITTLRPSRGHRRRGRL